MSARSSRRGRRTRPYVHRRAEPLDEELQEPAEPPPYVLSDRGIKVVEWMTYGAIALLALLVLVAILEKCGTGGFCGWKFGQ